MGQTRRVPLEIVVAEGPLLEVWRTIHKPRHLDDQLSADEVAERSTRNRLTLAYADGELVGNATVRPPHDPDRVATVIVRVLPDHRRQGYGAAYLTAELATARALGARRIETVVLASNLDGLAFAHSHGFVEHARTWSRGTKPPSSTCTCPESGSLIPFGQAVRRARTVALRARATSPTSVG